MDKPRKLDGVLESKRFPLCQAAFRASIDFTKPTQAGPDVDTPAEMIPYESDGLMAYGQPPMVVGPNLDHLMPLKVLPGFPLCRLLFGRG